MYDQYINLFKTDTSADSEELNVDANSVIVEQRRHVAKKMYHILEYSTTDMKKHTFYLQGKCLIIFHPDAWIIVHQFPVQEYEAMRPTVGLESWWEQTGAET